MNSNFQRRRLRRNRNNNKRKGATAVEFAFTFPIIMTFFIGIIAVTQAFFIRDMTQLAAYECARQGTVLDATPADVQAKATEVMRTMGLQDYEVQITPSNFSNSTKEIEVRVSVPIHRNAWVSGPFLPSSWTVGSSVSLRKTDDQ